MSRGDGRRGCLTPEEVTLLAGEDSRTPDVLVHLDSCPRCRSALEEARLNHVFLRELLSEWSPALSSDGADPVESERAEHPSRGGALPQTEGSALRDYRLLHEIHRGGQGIVYRGVHEPTGRHAAVKIMRLGSLRRRTRMQREASLVAALRHPNIVALHDCGELSDGGYAIAMDLAQGEMLDDWARRVRAEGGSRRETIRRMVGVVAKVCDAVQHAHVRGVIHRDLKPSNVMVDADDEPHLLDFGIARRANEEAAVDRVTMTGEIACTLAYAAPEQVSGDASLVDARSDIYALGVLLYELLTGTLPYSVNGAVAETVDHIRATAPVPPRALDGTIDIDLQTVILKTLAKEPERRYQSAAGLRSDLIHWLSGEGIDARRDSRLYVLRKSLRRNRGAVLVASATGLAILAGTVIASVAASRSAHARDLAALEQRRAREEARRWEAVAEVLHELIPAVDPQFEAYQYGPMHRAVLDLSDKLALGLFAEDPQAQAAVHTAMGDVCVRRGSPRLAEVQYREALRVVMMEPDPDPDRVAVAQRRLAELLTKRRGFDDALRFASASVDTLRGLGETAHLEMAMSLRCLAQIRLGRGEAPEALELCREALALGAESGLDAGAASAIRMTLAQSLLAAGDADAAMAEARQAAADSFESLSDLHPEVAESIGVLASCTSVTDPSSASDLRRLADAMFGQRASAEDLGLLLELKISLLGADHPDLVETHFLKVKALGSHGSTPELLAATEEALHVARRTFGSRSMEVADVLSMLWSTQMELGDVAGAHDSLVEQLSIQRSQLPGKDDVRLVVAIREVAQYCHWMERHEETDRYFAEALAYADEHLGDPHREYAWLLNRYAQHLGLHRNDPVAGMRELNRAIAMLERIDPSPSFHLGEMRLARAQMLAMEGKTTEAAEELRRLIAICNASPEAGATRRDWARAARPTFERAGDATCTALMEELERGDDATGAGADR